jgi:hypothetical protein
MAPIDRKTIAESKRLRRRHTCGGLCEKPDIISNFSTAKRAIPSLYEVLPVFDPAFTRCWQLQVGCKASTTQFTFNADIFERDFLAKGGLVRFERGSSGDTSQVAEVARDKLRQNVACTGAHVF